MRSTENGVTRRENRNLFLLDLSTTQMQIFGVKQPAHPPNNMNQGVACCSLQAWQTLAFPLGGRTAHTRHTPKEMDSLYPWLRFTPKGKGLLQNTEKQKHKIEHFLLDQDCDKTSTPIVHLSTFTHSLVKTLLTWDLPLLPENVIFSRGASSFLKAL